MILLLWCPMSLGCRLMRWSQICCMFRFLHRSFSVAAPESKTFIQATGNKNAAASTTRVVSCSQKRRVPLAVTVPPVMLPDFLYFLRQGLADIARHVIGCHLTQDSEGPKCCGLDDAACPAFLRSYPWSSS